MSRQGKRYLRAFFVGTYGWMAAGGGAWQVFSILPLLFAFWVTDSLNGGWDD